MYCVRYVPIFEHYMHPIEFWNVKFPKNPQIFAN